MLENCKTREERWDGVNALVERWLAERQELIVLYCSLSGVHAFSPNSTQSIGKLNQFCEILLDYVSAGHFEVYEQLVKEAEAFDDKGASDLLEASMPALKSSTEAALNFNDKFDTTERCRDKMAELKADLSLLGESLVARFDLEDQLISELHDSHSEMVA